MQNDFVLFRGANLIHPNRIADIYAELRACQQYKAADGHGLRWLAGGRSNSQKAVAVIGLHGMVDKRRSWVMDIMGGTSTDEFGRTFAALVDDPNIKGIVIDTDSPGGSAIGVPELSRQIYEARDKKPIVAVSNSEMDSAAYWIGSSAQKIFVTPSSYTGSIGVWSAAAEYSKQMEQDGVKVHVWRSEGSPNKAPFLPWQEFTADAVASEQMEVDRIYGDFISAVARNRGVSVGHAQKSFGQGRSMDSKAAVDAGLADRVATLDEVVSRMMAGKLTHGAMENIDAAFSEEVPIDESWREMNAMERKRVELRRKGVAV